MTSPHRQCSPWLCLDALVWLVVYTVNVCTLGYGYAFARTIHYNNWKKMNEPEMNEIKALPSQRYCLASGDDLSCESQKTTNGAINGWEMELSDSVNV